mgnify:CR=1 FL=1
MLHGISVGHIAATVLEAHLGPRPQAGTKPQSMREGETLARPCLATAEPAPCARPPEGGRAAKRTRGGS